MFQSTHQLDFEVAPWHDPEYKLFRVGTCEGMWYSNSTSYILIAILNNEPGNGHLNDVFEWFENSCKRDKKKLQVVEIMNHRFFYHLTTKRGFKAINGDNVEKTF